MTPVARRPVLLVICLATAGWAFSFGVGTQAVSHWLKLQHASDGVIGLNHSTYYFGLALASLFVPRLMSRLGRTCAPAGMVISSLTLALFPWSGWPALSFILRFVNGAAAGMCLVPIETLISTASDPRAKTRNFGFYALALTVGGAAGIRTGLHFPLEALTEAFLLGSVTPLAGGFILWLRLPAMPKEKHGLFKKPVSLGSNGFLSYGTSWSQGFLEGGMLAFLSFFLISRGMSAASAGDLMGLTMLGVILFQVPVSWLADRLGRLPVLLVCYAVVLGGLIIVPLCGAGVWLAFWLFLLGACSGAFYPLGLAMLGEGCPQERLPRLFAWYMAIECFGSQMGAGLMGKARDWWGEAAMFSVGLAAVSGVLLTWLLCRALTGRAPGHAAPSRIR